MALPSSTWLSTTLHHGSIYWGFTLLYYTLLWLYLLYLTFLYTLPWLYLALLDCMTLYHGSTWLYLTAWHCTMALLGSTWLFYSLPCHCFTLFQSATFCHGSTCLYLTLLNTLSWFYLTLPWIYMAVSYSATLYHGSPWLYLNLDLDMTLSCIRISLLYPHLLNKHSTQHFSLHILPHKRHLPCSAAIKFHDIIIFTLTCHIDPALLMHSTASAYKTDHISHAQYSSYTVATHNITHSPCTSMCTTHSALPTLLSTIFLTH